MMKSCQARLLLALAACAGPVFVQHASAAAEAGTPIGRVVGLLQGLQTKLEEDLKAEEAIFEEYVCWYRAVVDTKTASNSAASSRVESLKAYIADIEAGRITFTTEEADLQKQIASLKQDLQTAEDLRNSEHTDYQAAVQEMQTAITALDGAIQTLENPTPASSSLVSMRRRQHLQQALVFSRSLLSKGQVEVLEGMLGGEVPQPDWKKLNRKATFKHKYESRSGEIIKTLKNLKATFSSNLQEAEDKETAAADTYEKLKTAKGDMLSKVEQALTDMVEETGARTLSKTEAQAEVDALETQVEDDEKFISDAEASHTTKKQEWEAREELRRKEITAISEAIAVLHSDDARDVFTKSYSFLQLQQVASSNPSAAVALRALASASPKGSRSAALLQAAASSGTRSISLVIEHVDALLTELSNEEASDLTTKESCETERSKLTRQAKTESVAIDELTEEIVRAKSKSEEIEEQIKEQEETIVHLNGTVHDLTRQREDENTQYLADKADDQKAIELIDQAILIFDKLKTDMAGGAAGGSSGGGFLQVSASHAAVAPHVPAAAAASPVAGLAAIGARVSATSSGKHAEPYEITAGQAPPPPPSTWKDPSYAGATGETNGVASILSLLKDDIAADISTADSDEAEAVTSYNKEKGELEAAITAAEAAISAYEGEQAVQDQKVVDKSQERATEKTALESTMTQIEAVKPGCDFALVNFEVRNKKRQIEMDGLRKAKDILQGGKFSS